MKLRDAKVGDYIVPKQDIFTRIVDINLTKGKCYKILRFNETVYGNILLSTESDSEYTTMYSTELNKYHSDESNPFTFISKEQLRAKKIKEIFK